MATIETRQPLTATPPASTALTPAAIDRRAWRFAALVIVAALLLSSAPYVFAAISAPPDKHFMGLVINVPDHVQYFSWMRDLSTANLAADRLTAEPNEPAFFNLLWWALGRFGQLTGLDYAGLYMMLRLVAIVVCLVCCYGFLRIAFEEEKRRRVSLLIVTFGGGLGIVWIVVKYAMRLPEAPFPFDIYTTEPNTFFNLMGFPHFALALGLLVATFGLVLTAIRKQQHRYSIAAGIIALILGLQHAYDLVTIYAVLGLFGALLWLRDRRFPRFLFMSGLIVFGLSMPPAAYSLLLVKANPVWGEVLEQFDLAGAFTPGPLNLPILLGIPFVLALLAFRPRMLRSQSDVELFVAAWFLSHFMLVYLPVDFQIHLLLGWQIPIAILATRFLFDRVAWAHKRRLMAAGLVVLMLVTNVYLLAWRFIDLRRYETPYFLPQSDIAALSWLAENAASSDVVLADLDFGQYVPTWSDARSFLAHWTGTLRYLDKQKMVDVVLGEQASDAERMAILMDSGVTYVVSRAGGGDELADLPALTPAFNNGQTVIYRVQSVP
ncbi:MAG TPA: hypothetical protein VJG32_03315 [Anaerolineae bacterium]|nr:hypothetical protein [Anaerolineae bacterium]